MEEKELGAVEACKLNGSQLHFVLVKKKAALEFTTKHLACGS